MFYLYEICSKRLGLVALVGALTIIFGCSSPNKWQPTEAGYQQYLQNVSIFQGTITEMSTADYNGDEVPDIWLQIRSQEHEYIFIITFPQNNSGAKREENYRKYLINHDCDKYVNYNGFLSNLKVGDIVKIPTSQGFDYYEGNIDYRFVYLPGDNLNFPNKLPS